MEPQSDESFIRDGIRSGNGGNRDPGVSFVATVLNRIAEEIRNNLFCPVFVAAHDGQWIDNLDRDVPLANQIGLFEQHFVDHGLDIHSTGVHVNLACLGQVNQIVHEPFGLAQARFDVRHVPLEVRLRQRFERACQPGHRVLQQHEVRAHVVRQGAHQVIHIVMRATNLPGHLRILATRSRVGVRDLDTTGRHGLLPRKNAYHRQHQQEMQPPTDWVQA